MDPLHKKVIFRTLGFFFMWCLSSWFFVLVEHTEESDVEVKRKILQSTFDSMASKYNMSIQDFNNFSNMAYEALSEPKRQWTYNVAMRFVFQALTTIGYGYITPQTPQGQLMCILVAVPGIPITILAFQAIGEMIARWVNNIVEKIERKILKREEPRGMQTKSLMFLVSLTLALIAVNGSVMMDPYEWTFVEAVYFWFVTLTTIGFGDYTMVRSQRIMELSINISQNHDEGKDEAEQKTFEIFAGLFFLFDLILCLCIVSSVLNSVVAFIEENKFRATCPGCVSRRTQDQVDNETNNISSNFGFQREENAMSMTSVEL